MADEGYIKFNCQWQRGELPDKSSIAELNGWRQELYRHQLIGVDSNGVGYGNISHRLSKNTFIITGSATGGLEKLSDRHYALVNRYNIGQNTLACTGRVPASSESLSHAAIYEALPWVRAVVHVHHPLLWQQLLNTKPTTPVNAAYGTPEMARALQKIIKGKNSKNSGIIIMGGHQDGIITYGQDLGAAADMIVNLLL